MVFHDYAKLYHAAGLQVIPLVTGDKKPFMTGWSRWSKEKISREEMDNWVRSHPQSNIGIVTGEASNVCIVDIDTPDLDLARKLEEALPRSPWRRVGQKGCALAFKLRADQTQSFKIKDSQDKMLVEYMANGTQIVLPPSIHPVTKQPYTATSNLWEVIDQLPELPDEIELVLRSVCMSHGVNLSSKGRIGFTGYIPAGARDVTLTQMSGYCAHAILIGQMKLGQAIGVIRVKSVELSEKVAGDVVDPEKHVRNFIKFLINDVKGKNRSLPKDWSDDVSAEELEAYGLLDLIQHTDWKYEEYISHLAEQFRVIQPDDPRLMSVIEDALERLAKSRMSQLEVERVIHYLHVGSKSGLKPAALKKRLTQIKHGEIEGRDHSQLAAVMLDELKKITDVSEMGGALGSFNGSHWETLSAKEVKAQISRDFGHLDGCRKSSDVHGIYQLMLIRADVLPTEPAIPGVNFVNGFLTDNLALIDHNPELATRHTLPFRYLENASMPPKFSQFLHDCWGHEEDFNERIITLRQVMAATLFGLGPAYQKAILLFGAAGSGKSQLLKIFEAIVPDDARCYINPTKWGDPYSPAELQGKLLNIAGELSETEFIPGGPFKELVDGSEQTVRKIYCSPFKMRPLAIHLFASNHFPKSRDTSEGFLRRWIVFTFTKVVPENARTLNIGDIIAREEREQIASWAVGAFEGGRPNQFSIPPSSATMVKQLSYTTNNVRGWLDTQVKFGTIDSLNGLDERLVYLRYFAFCQGGNNHKPVSQSTFRQRMIELSQIFPDKFTVTHDGRYLGLVL